MCVKPRKLKVSGRDLGKPIILMLPNDAVDQRDSVTNEHLASSVQYEHALLLSCVDLDETHRRSGHGFAGRLASAFLGLDGGLHAARGVNKRRILTPPSCSLSP